MSKSLLERDGELAAFLEAVADAAAGRGSAVLVTGEAGIGKTTAIHAFRRALDPGTRVLAGACDDLLAPRTLGPLRDAARGTGGPLERALAETSPDEIFGGIVEELAASAPSVLVVEDVHWADDATIDVLRYLARRLEWLPAVVVLSVRDDAVRPGDRLEQLLATLAATRVHRLALSPLSASAVSELAAGTGRQTAELVALTRGNPFYLTEVLAGPPDEVPATVADTVLARLHRLGEGSRAGLEQLSVIPTIVELDLAEALLGDGFESLAEAERLGMVEITTAGLAFRHELARRAIEASQPAIRRRSCNRAVVQALRALPAYGEQDLTRLVHHAVLAADADTVVEYAPRAAREATRAGSHRQALALFEAALPYADRLAPAERARVVDEYAWELYNAHRFDDAVAAGREAVDRYERLGDSVPLGEALLRLSRHIYMTGRTDEADQAVERAVHVLEPAGFLPALAHALTHQGAILALTGRSEQAAETLERALRLAEEAERLDLVALALNYRGMVRCDLSGPDGLRYLRRSLAIALDNGYHEYAARAYTNLAEMLYRFALHDELARCLHEGLTFTRERGFWSHAYNLELHRCLLLVRQGDWDDAEEALRQLVDAVDEPGMLYVYSVPPFARLLARRGRPEAEQMLVASWDRAVRQKSVLGIAYAGIACVEWAWLAGRPDAIGVVRDVVLAATTRPGAAPLRAELLRYLARAGLGCKAFDGCPEPYATGLRGDWRAAAAAWEIAGDRYEQALELADSGEAAPMLEALRLLDELGASAAATLVRRRLKELGVQRVPRGPKPATRANPGGLTDRQLDVLALLDQDLTNAEIAERLVVSVRTVDHHVSAILAKLGTSTRREAIAAARSLGPASQGPHRRR